MNETVHEDVKDGALVHALNDDGKGKSNNMNHGQNHEMRSGCSGNCMSNLSNPSRICPNNKCISGIHEKISSDTTLGEEGIGQHVKTIGKPKRY